MKSSTASSRVAPAPGPVTFRRDRMVHGWLVLKAVSDVGDAAWTVGLAWTAVQVASPAAAGAVVAAGTLPRALLLLVGGTLADRLDARRVMATANLVRVVVLVATALTATLVGASLPLLLVAAVLFGMCDAVYEPSASTIGRQLVEAGALTAYTGTSHTLSRCGTLAGAGLGGLVVAGTGIGGSAVLNAVSFGAVAWYLTRRLVVRFPPPRHQPVPVVTGIAATVAHLRVEPTTRVLVLALSGLNLVVGPALGVGLALRVDGEGWGATTLGVAAALVASGAVVGSLVAARLECRRPTVVAFGALVVQGAAIVLLGVGDQVTLAAGCVTIGVTSGLASVLLSAVFVAVADPAHLGRLAAFQRMGDDVLMPLATIGFAAVLTATSATSTYAAAGGAMVVAAAVPLSIRRLRSVTNASTTPSRDVRG